MNVANTASNIIPLKEPLNTYSISLVRAFPPSSTVVTGVGLIAEIPPVVDTKSKYMYEKKQQNDYVAQYVYTYIICIYLTYLSALLWEKM